MIGNSTAESVQCRKDNINAHVNSSLTQQNLKTYWEIISLFDKYVLTSTIYKSFSQSKKSFLVPSTRKFDLK